MEAKLLYTMITIKGKEEGPSLLVVCGTHYNEPEGHSAFLDIVDSIGPKRIKETFVKRGIPSLTVELGGATIDYLKNT